MFPALFLIVIAVVAANLPWLSERILLVRRPGAAGKRAWWRWLEWLLLYCLVGGLALGLENKLNGEIYPQGWEFYAITLCLFLVFALPGFLYRYEFRHLLDRR
ncbi:DUF2818 family protein [Sulfurivermis fontis]|uniref:DUF2818 family protein n=1 Tax=Sulfurivermis fontis TaxID=1972068 RepID=UPI000FD72B72|nr:DUF2818 family protein [Sulfurivermis fontis]